MAYQAKTEIVSHLKKIFINSDPTAPEEPKTATFKGLLGKNGDFLTLKIKNYVMNYFSYFIKKLTFKEITQCEIIKFRPIVIIKKQT